MKTEFNSYPREFAIKGVTIKDWGKIYLEDNEMVSFKNVSGKECDFTAKNWGFYATPSVNGRLKNNGFKTALVVNETNQIYIMVVDCNKIDEFKNYLKNGQNNKIICWMDEWFAEEI